MISRDSTPEEPAVRTRVSALRTGMKKRVKTYTISAVAELYDVHPQTLRLYEREGLLRPSRSIGNTRLYEDSDLERLEVILSLTRELGVNLAGVEIILNMREKMDQMQREFEKFFEYLKTHASEFSRQSDAFSPSEALIPISRFRVTRMQAEVSGEE
jgi:MerR family transcriptional regulator/heat shock protein HspR